MLYFIDNNNLNRLLYSKKKDGHVVQFQIIVTTDGSIAEVVGPFVGSSWIQDKYCLDMITNQLFLADCEDDKRFAFTDILDRDKGIFIVIFNIFNI